MTKPKILEYWGIVRPKQDYGKMGALYAQSKSAERYRHYTPKVRLLEDGGTICSKQDY